MRNPSESPYQTALVVSTGFLVLALLFSWQWAIWVALAVGLGSSLSLKLTRIVHRLWMGLAHLLGRIIPNLVWTIVFYLILTPIALVYRLCNRDPLHCRGQQNSMFHAYTGDQPAQKDFFDKTW